MRLDSKLSYWNQIKYINYNVAHITIKLRWLIDNVGGPTPSKSLLLMAIRESIPMYGCEIWSDAVKTEKKNHSMLKSLSLTN